jgi:hypothetical protein
MERTRSRPRRRSPILDAAKHAARVRGDVDSVKLAVGLSEPSPPKNAAIVGNREPFTGFNSMDSQNAT